MEITSGFIPGAIGGIAALHGAHYAQVWGFGTFFEAKVATEVSEFAMRVGDDDLVLLGHDAHGMAGSLVLDLNDPSSGARGAHLRWFIVHDRCRGAGIGRQFMQRAMEHVDERAQGKAWLTTFAGLDAARHLYESFGFALVTETEGNAWGTTVREQEFHRVPPVPLVWTKALRQESWKAKGQQ